MIDIEIKNERRMALYLDRLSAEMVDAIKNVVTRQSRALTAYIKRRYLSGGTSGTSVAVRTGQLRRMTKPKPTKIQRTGITAGVEFGAWYSKMHVGRRGKRTTITPSKKGRQYLAIPLPTARVGSGKSRARPRDFADTFVFRSRSGNLLIGQKKGPGELLPLFVLKQQVIVEARVHTDDIVRTWSPKVARDIEHTMSRAL